MTLIEFPRKRRNSGALLLVLLDLQEEYVCEDRPYVIPGVSACLDNCRRLLASARDVGLPVAHFRQLRRGPFFNEDMRYSRWIEGFTPNTSEMVYERAMPSCFHSGVFANFMSSIEDPVLLIAGLSADRACLSSIIDAAHRRHTAFFISDASATPPISRWPQELSHAFTTDLISQFCHVMTTSEALEHLHHSDPACWSAYGGH